MGKALDIIGVSVLLNEDIINYLDQIMLHIYLVLCYVMKNYRTIFFSDVFAGESKQYPVGHQ